MQENKYFLDAFDKVKPTQEEKNEILKNILNHSSKKKFVRMTVFRTCSLGVFTLCLFFLYNSTVQDSLSRTRVVPIAISYDEISFDGKCYQETVFENQEIGNYLGMMEKENKNCLLYAHKKDEKIVFLFKEGEYIPYEEVVCK